MSNFYLPDTYYDPPEPHEAPLDVDAGEVADCPVTGLVDAYTWDGVTWTWFCDKCETDHDVQREPDEPDYEAMAEAQREMQEYDYEHPEPYDYDDKY